MSKEHPRPRPPTGPVALPPRGPVTPDQMNARVRVPFRVWVAVTVPNGPLAHKRARDFVKVMVEDRLGPLVEILAVEEAK